MTNVYTARESGNQRVRVFCPTPNPRFLYTIYKATTLHPHPFRLPLSLRPSVCVPGDLGHLLFSSSQIESDFLSKHLLYYGLVILPHLLLVNLLLNPPRPVPLFLLHSPPLQICLWILSFVAFLGAPLYFTVTLFSPVLTSECSQRSGNVTYRTRRE